MTENKQILDTLIIGSGPAGLTAAIYNSRANLKTMVIAGNQPGGQLTITTLVDNYPGFPTGVGGLKLMMDMQQQVKNFGVEIKQGVVTAINKIDGSANFRVKLESGEEIETKTVIVTTGAAVKWLGLPGEKELIGRGISGCATCDGMFFRGKTVAVVGGGDTACEEADFLAKICQKVYLIHRRDELRASATEQKKVLNNPKIEIWWNSEVKGLKGKEKLEAVEVINNKTQEKKELILDGLFVAIGSQPATEFLKGLVELSPTGQVLTGGDKNWVTMTSVPGIFAGGDCVNNRHKQAIVAAGEGCRAALDAENWLNS
ncbi:MAG TPA: thioredoxin-disulfide reductase [Candidatus Woesebacteria bacterium]|jgi:thioredoxin reductase (NADPH)|nr:thioredoxin-disulfide reductase [Candidatus Shapirobacteria bacterium]HOR01995.1 thioredoxin-disulfide reductase [Candidatus Woesebacteria bacterium]